MGTLNKGQMFCTSCRKNQIPLNKTYCDPCAEERNKKSKLVYAKAYYKNEEAFEKKKEGKRTEKQRATQKRLRDKINPNDTYFNTQRKKWNQVTLYTILCKQCEKEDTVFSPKQRRCKECRVKNKKIVHLGKVKGVIFYHKDKDDLKLGLDRVIVIEPEDVYLADVGYRSFYKWENDKVYGLLDESTGRYIIWWSNIVKIDWKIIW